MHLLARRVRRHDREDFAQRGSRLIQRAGSVTQRGRLSTRGIIQRRRFRGVFQRAGADKDV
jgi:hypothetical protein